MKRKFLITGFLNLFGGGDNIVEAKTHREALSIFLGVKSSKISAKRQKGKLFDFSVRTVDENGNYTRKDKNYNYYLNN